jgi:hypothetical protein
MRVQRFPLYEQVRKLYLDNFRLSLSFSILLVFVFFFIQFNNTALLNGTIFFDYSFTALSVHVLAAQVIAWLVFLAMYSILLTLLLLGVRHDLSRVRIGKYLKEMVQAFSIKMLVYFILLSVLFILVMFLGQWAGLDIIWVNVLLWLVSLAFLFVPQSLVVDEKPILDAIETNFYVIVSNPKDFLLVVIVSSFLVGLLPVIEYFFASLGIWGGVIGIIVMFVFIIPSLEILKTLLYMRRFELVRGHEYARTRISGLHKL